VQLGSFEVQGDSVGFLCLQHEPFPFLQQGLSEGSVGVDWEEEEQFFGGGVGGGTYIHVSCSEVEGGLGGLQGVGTGTNTHIS